MVSDFIVIYVARYDMLPPGIGSKWVCLYR
jgi:hypothetical protein